MAQGEPDLLTLLCGIVCFIFILVTIALLCVGIISAVNGEPSGTYIPYFFGTLVAGGIAGAAGAATAYSVY